MFPNIAKSFPSIKKNLRVGRNKALKVGASMLDKLASSRMQSSRLGTHSGLISTGPD